VKAPGRRTQQNQKSAIENHQSSISSVLGDEPVGLRHVKQEEESRRN
jgi:hypothetical protein